MNKKTGQVYSVHTNKYHVKTDNGMVECNARGLIKFKRDDIVVGDFVEIDGTAISQVLERKNRFIRPNVCNIDLIVAVICPQPKPDLYLIDKLLVNAVKEGVEVVLVANKSDIIDTEFDKIFAEYNKLGIKTLSISCAKGDNISELKQLLSNKLSVLAGQSAVGKTSIINAMFSLNLKTGELSDKIERGKHTTTRSTIFEHEGIRLIDSPGFAVIDAAVKANQLQDFYPEYANVAIKCKFRGCVHISEPDCMVKQLIESGVLSKERYQRYVEIYKELQNRRIKYEKN